MNLVHNSVLLLALAVALVAAPLPAAAQPATDAPATQTTAASAPAPEHPHFPSPEDIRQRWYLGGLIVLLLAIGVVYKWQRKRQLA